jgi:hypothetical protein
MDQLGLGVEGRYRVRVFYWSHVEARLRRAHARMEMAKYDEVQREGSPWSRIGA